ncbi:hypothetical protein CONPUDRAFT_146416 [Coniophora puteana RWD-64-598 SS2]|uniref:Uncharacterized protein n=1 Tax=Coniophora puteana (strain RWD-64-598) TaxID=741705 RepID=A0A5M3MCJ7_CONPW|nr:uncharacterized protein CONPUDRAFT_146416 [Coniophora puteana RWD-64-598 SS2]EIW76570.1 hypothetical protein CONPUDRAFT_146416 [Coniophora puteana RWD-64-598 SS2]
MSTFSLRPVVDHPPSPSSSSSTDRSPPHKHSASPHVSSALHGQPRRPISPGFLRDVNLEQDANDLPRKYPAPPTGHDLMAMFPPQAPANFGAIQPGATSHWFQRQERAFFAQAGKEIVRVRVEIDMPPQSSEEAHASSSKPRDSVGPRTWPALPPHPHHSPSQPSASHPYAHSKSSRQARAMPPMPTQTPTMHPVPAHPSQPPPHHTPGSYHANVTLRTAPTEVHQSSGAAPMEYTAGDDYRESSDDAWRRPTPYTDRRRAGKHTKRVIVRN